MAKRGMWVVVAALVATLALTGTAGAATAKLRFPVAKRLAVKLAKKQVRNRDVVSFHVVDAKRLSRTKIAFAYDDRTRDNVYCTATLLVTKMTSGRITRWKARFRGQDCNGIPRDALAVEAATRDAIRSLRATTLATEDSLERLTRSLRRCRKVEIPRSRRSAVRAIIDIATVEALEGPNDGALGDFTDALGGIDTSNLVLQNGIAGWTDYIAVIRSLPSIPDPCATIKQWAGAGWTADAAPIDLGEYRALDRRATGDQRAIGRAARYLATVGIFPRTAVRFTPAGLLLRRAPSATVRGGRAKPALL